MDTSKLEEQFAELRESNERLAEAVRIRDAEIGVLRRRGQVLSGEVIKYLQDGSLRGASTAAASGLRAALPRRENRGRGSGKSPQSGRLAVWPVA